MSQSIIYTQILCRKELITKKLKLHSMNRFQSLSQVLENQYSFYQESILDYEYPQQPYEPQSILQHEQKNSNSNIRKRQKRYNKKYDLNPKVKLQTQSNKQINMDDSLKAQQEKPNKKYYKKKKPEKDFIKTEDIIENKDINMQGLWTQKDIKKVFLKSMNNKTERQNFERAIASFFVTRGYDHKIICQVLRENVDYRYCLNCIISVMKFALRQLCNLVVLTFGNDIKIFNQQEQELLKSPLTHCRKWLREEESWTFFKIVNIVYAVNNEPIFQDELFQLYITLLKQLESRKIQASQRKFKRKYTDESRSLSAQKIPRQLSMTSNGKTPTTFVLNNSVVNQIYYQNPSQSYFINQNNKEDAQSYYKNSKTHEKDEKTNTLEQQQHSLKSKRKVLLKYMGEYTEKQNFERTAASVFVTRGYDHKIICQVLRENVDYRYYLNCMMSVMRFALRQLCTLMVLTFGNDIKIFNQQEQQLLKSPLTHCRKWLREEESWTFFKIVNIVYAVNNEPIFQDELFQLYITLLKELESRKIQASQRKFKRKYPDESRSLSAQRPTRQLSMTSNCKTPTTFVLNNSVVNQIYYQKSPYYSHNKEDTQSEQKKSNQRQKIKAQQQINNNQVKLQAQDFCK